MATTTSLSSSALFYALAALGNEGSGGGGGTGGTVSITVGEVKTGEPGTPVEIVNVGTSTDAIFNFTIPEGEPGANGEDGTDGSKWYVSNSAPGTIPTGIVLQENDLVLYSGAEIYQYRNNVLTNTNVSIRGSKWYFLNSDPSPIVPVGDFKSGDVLVFRDYSVWTIVSGVMINSGLNLKGPQGDSGFSPTITIKEDTEDTYILTITTSEGSFDTPNLKGTGTSPSTSMNPYQYAVMLGYEGSKNDFDQIYLSLLSGIIDGGNINGETSDIPGIGTGEVGDISTTELDPYAYAQSIGFTGTKEQFDEIYMSLLSGIVDGGLIEVLMKMAKSKQSN